ncbi:MAG: 23S rRNA (guanosine(2251)-2'-O)-methyltransferase RlmB [Clostridiales bacterium]|nr:23S rRNA (guanosine(2251)-2'-O)-methyltransferase RlmB [Clostridiales bacterium]
MGGQPSGYGPQGRSQGPRAQGPKTQGPRVQGPRPQGDDRNSRDFAPRDFSPRGFAPRSQSPRPYESRPQGEPRKFSPRPPQARPFDSHPAHPPRPARPPRPQENYRPVPPAPPAYNAPTNLEAADAVPAENLLSGRNPIREALKSGRDIEKLMVARGELSGSAREIVQMAKERHIPVQQVDRARLDAITTGHQGMLAFASAYQYHTVEDMLALAKEKGQDPFLVLLDGITDPHNLGAIIRTAECAGAHGVIVQERRAVGLTPAAVKASAGAVEYLPVARVTNLTQTIAELKKEKLWIYAAHMEGEDYTQVDYSGPLALVVGGEGEGVSRLVLEACDRRVSLPIRGQLDSLNASVAAGILLYAAMKGR